MNEETDNAVGVPIELSRKIGKAALDQDQLAMDIVYSNYIYQMNGNEDEKAWCLQLVKKWCTVHQVEGVGI